EEQDIHNDNAVTEVIHQDVVALVDNDNVDTDPDWNDAGPATSANRVGRPPKRGRGRPRVNQRGGNSNRGRGIRKHPQVQKEPRPNDQPSGEKKTVDPFFGARTTRAAAKKEDMFLQEAIRTSTEPDSRHESRALPASAVAETIVMNTSSCPKVGLEKPRPNYAVQPLRKPKTPRKLPAQIMNDGKKPRGNGGRSSFSGGSQYHAQEFKQAPEALIHPNGFTKEKQEEALQRYGDDVVATFHPTWREILKTSDGGNDQTMPMDVWKSLLDPKLAPRFRAPLSARYRDLKTQWKQKVEQATPKRNASIQPGKRRHEEQQEKLPGKQQDEEAAADLQAQGLQQKHPDPQHKQPGKRLHREVDVESQGQGPVSPDAKRRKLAASPQPQPQPQPQPKSHPRSPSGGPRPTKKGSAWRLIRDQPPSSRNHTATATTDSSSASGKQLDMGGGGSAATETTTSPSKKFSFKIQTKNAVGKVQVQRKNSLMPEPR
ncbi:hypothetical protein B0T20DRAFT_355635, partial [Sordaria brevicollis]